MCLYITDGVDEEIRAALERYGEIIAYKYYGSRNSCLVSPFQGTLIDRPGEVVSSREAVYSNSLRETELHQVEVGIHVFLDECSAKVCAANDGRVELVVAVVCKKEHFVAGGYYGAHRSAVFSRITISEDEWYKHFTKPPHAPQPLEDIRMAGEGNFLGGVGKVISATASSVKFKCESLVWECGLDYFLKLRRPI